MSYALGDLSALTDREWENLCIWSYISDNYRRYVSGLLRSLHGFYIPSEEIESTILSIAYPLLQKQHAAVLHLKGTERNRAMLGVLKKIVFTRVKDQLVKEYDLYVNKIPLGNENGEDIDFEVLKESPAHNTYYFSDGLPDPDDDTGNDPQLQERSNQVELLRPILTNQQSRYLRAVYVDKLSYTQVAERDNCSPSNVRSVMRGARQRLQDLLEQDPKF